MEMRLGLGVEIGISEDNPKMRIAAILPRIAGANRPAPRIADTAGGPASFFVSFAFESSPPC
jgi:hypothetical protein